MGQYLLPTTREMGGYISILERPGDLDDGEVTLDGETHKVRRLKYGSDAHRKMLLDVSKTSFIEKASGELDE